jgi:drug/metabolite transporter (DMT)-like permease
MNDRRKGQFGLLLVAIIWGSGFVMSSISLDYFSPIHVLALRFGLAFLLMVLLFHNQLKKVRKGTVFKGMALGVLLYLAFLFQTVGLVYTTPSKNAFLTAFNVVLVPLISALFLKKKLAFPAIVGACLAISGIAVISLNDFNNINLGDILTLICALFFALQIIYTNLYVIGENVYALNTIQMGTAAVCAILVALIEGKSPDFSHLDGNLAVLYLGAISTMLPFLLQTTSQQFTKETETAIILSTESVFGMLFSILLLNEEVTVRMLIGAALILLGVVVVELKPKVKKEVMEDYGRKECDH